MTTDEIIELFVNHQLDVQKYFGSYGAFFSFINKRGRIDEVKPEEVGDSEYWENYYIEWLYKINKDEFYNSVLSQLSDVEFENGKFYFVGDREDLSELFCDGGRNDLSQQTIRSMLSGEYDYDFYDYGSTNVYDDVIDSLDEKNLNYLGERIIKILKNEEIEPYTDLLEKIASDQNHPEFVIINSDNIKFILNDKETMDELFENELSDLESELSSLYNSAYNSAYESEVWNKIWNELDDYFEGRGEWIQRKHRYKSDVMVEYFKIPIYNFDKYILEYLNRNAGYTHGSLTYQGNYIGVLKESIECLSVYPPDYASNVDEHINEMFRDYI